MAEKDIMEKTLESHEDVFADIVNVLLFGGKNSSGLKICKKKRRVQFIKQMESYAKQSGT